jgi:hypothetical protein
MKPQDNNSKRSAARQERDDGSRRRFLKVSSLFSLAVALTPGAIAKAFTKSQPGIDQTHFAAWEQPELFVDEMRASFKTLRSA